MKRILLLLLVGLLLPAPVFSQARDAQGDPLPPGAIARLGTTRLFHPLFVSGAAVAPDGNLAAVVTGGEVYLWHLPTGKLVRRLQPDKEHVRALAFAPDGKMLALAGNDGVLRLWNVERGIMAQRLKGHDRAILAVAYSPTGAFIATAGADKTVRLWDPVKAKEVHALKKHRDAAKALAFSRDGSKLLTAGRDGLRLWNAATGAALKQFAGPKEPISRLAFCFDDKTLMIGVAGPADKEARRPVQLWDLETGQLLAAIGDPSHLEQWFLPAPDGKTAAVFNASSSLTIWDVVSGAKRAQLGQTWVAEQSAAFSPDAKTLVVIGRDNCLRVWDLDRKLERPLAAEGHPAPVSRLAFSPTQPMLATGTYQSLHLWDLSTGKELVPPAPHGQCRSLEFAPDGRRLASAVWQGNSSVLEMANFLPQQSLANRFHTAVAWSADGRTVALGAHQGAITLFEGGGFKQRETLPGPPGFQKSDVSCLAFAPKDEWLAAGYNDLARRGTVRLWNLQKAEAAWTLAEPDAWVTFVGFVQDGKALATGHSDGTLRLRDLASGKETRRFFEDKKATFGNYPFAVSPDGKRAATAVNTTVRLLDLASGKELRQYPGHGAWVNALAFSADGQLLATASQDKTVLIWEGAPSGDTKSVVVDAKTLERLWGDLHGKDLLAAFRAAEALAASPDKSLPWIKQKLAAGKKESLDDRIARLVDDLDHDEFSLREDALVALKKLGPAAYPTMRKLLPKARSAEMGVRLKVLLSQADDKPPPRVQFLDDDAIAAVRLLRLLDRLPGPDAQRLVEDFARGNPFSPATLEARLALERRLIQLPQK